MSYPCSYTLRTGINRYRNDGETPPDVQARVARMAKLAAVGRPLFGGPRPAERDLMKMAMREDAR